MLADFVIRDARGERDIADARRLFEAYAASIGVDLCFQNFDQELADLPGAYSAPRGCLLIAAQDALPIGCIALRPLAVVVGVAATTGEVKRLYVRPGVRGGGVGRALAQAVIERAQAIGYDELKLDTLDWMNAARALYEQTGFRACAPYYVNPIPGVVYMSLRLRDAVGG
jgi:putative acetyltransferase